MKNAHAQVLIIGSGASGAMMALSLAEAGLDVVCLEQGDWTTAEQHPHFSPDWEWKLNTDWGLVANNRGRSSDYPVDTRDEMSTMWNAVGGSTVIYTGVWPRLRPSDFRKGTEHGCAPDWPISYEDLLPYYEASDRLIGVSGLAGDPALPPCGPFPTGPLHHGPFGRAAAAGFERLGWHWWPIPVSVISEDYDGRKGCNNCGNCQSGCPRGSLGDMSVVIWPKALRQGARLKTMARVEEIEIDANGRAKGAVYINRLTGERERQTADVVVVAANGIGTPRLLLLSQSGRFPNGLANSSDQLGRNLMHHTIVLSEIWTPEPIATHIGPSGALISEQFAETDVSRGFVNGFNINVLRPNGPGGQMANSFTGKLAPWGKAHRGYFDSHFDHVICAAALGDDLPQSSNRVTLSSTIFDSNGMAAPHIHYKPHENDRLLMGYSKERLRDLAHAVNATDYAINDHVTGGEYCPPTWHHLGTARMGNHRETSVINKWHQSWDVPNLYIVDGSSFPTGGPVNPTSTICALALRAAEHLKTQFRDATTAMRTYA